MKNQNELFKFWGLILKERHVVYQGDQKASGTKSLFLFHLWEVTTKQVLSSKTRKQSIVFEMLRIRLPVD